MEKILIASLIIILASSCYSSDDINSNENVIHRAVRGFRAGTENIQSEKLFKRIAAEDSTATEAQKSYALMYLAKIQLSKNNIEEAKEFLAQAMQISETFPFEYEILGNYFYEKKEYLKSKKYYTLLTQWIDKRIRNTEDGNFDLNKLEFMNIRSYFDRKFENKYIEMYNKKKTIEFRKEIYIMYLKDRKENALNRLLIIK